MVKQIIATGAVANDGTGDTLRGAGDKINQNFTEIYDTIGVNGAVHQVSFDSTSVVFEGTLADAFETRLKAVEPTTIDNDILLPDSSGTIDLIASPSTLTNKTLTSPKINSGILTTPRINDTSADHQYIFAVSELADNRTITLPLLTGNDTIVFNNHTQTLENKSLYRPNIQQALNDSLGNEMIEFDRQGTLSHIKVSNANSPSISAASSNANAFLTLSGKGTSGVSVNKLFVDYFVASQPGNNPAVFDSVAYHAAGFIICDLPSPNPLPLDDGTAHGEMKYYVNKNNGVATITPTNFAQGTSFALKLNASAQVIWDGSYWHMMTGMYTQTDSSSGPAVTIT